jgi:hypothetical protein
MEDRYREVEMKKYVGVCAIAVIFFAVPAAMFSQTSSSAPAKDEKTVEESYLEESLEALVIREQAQAESLTMKQEAIDGIKSALDKGRKSDEIYKSLDYLALEGIFTQTRSAGLGKPTNNFPQIRSQACALLGTMNTEQARDTLVKVVFADNESMVISSAIRALGTMGNLMNDEVTTAINYIVNRYDILAPDNTLAFESLVAFDKYAEANGGIKDNSIIHTIIKIADGNYNTETRKKASEVLMNLRKYAAKNTKK